MVKFKSLKIIANTFLLISTLALIPTGVSAEWKQDSNGWWYSEGSSWAIGERKIDGHYYYFEPTGYMATGWRKVNDNLKYYDSNGYGKTGWLQYNGNMYYISPLDRNVQTNTYIDGWYTNSDGVASKCINIGNFEIDKVTGTIVRYNGNDTSLVVPKEIAGIEIKRIHHKAFYNCSNLKNITIQNNITYVNGSAFEGCKNLENIIVNDDNTNYSSVNGVLLNKSKTELIRCPEGKKDSNCAIPDSVITLDWYAFEYCYSLPSISVPDSIKNIGKGSFDKKSNTILYVKSEKMKHSLILDGIDSNKIIVHS